MLNTYKCLIGNKILVIVKILINCFSDNNKKSSKNCPIFVQFSKINILKLKLFVMLAIIGITFFVIAVIGVLKHNYEHAQLKNNEDIVGLRFLDMAVASSG